MRIRRLDVQGFKSFADRTSFHFGPGISALVGPNGCGKSNVVDAIRWVMGEQSASTLRGRQMEDVVFAGSERRAACGFAEVTLGFDHAEGRFPGPLARFAEIDVGRRLHRNGDSDYLINRASSRLKDVTGLFLDAGVGARAYSIIEQGSVGFVMAAKPEERRALIDEVAGVNRFRVQRAEAERRLDQCRDNLARVRDLWEELGRQRKTLEGQAERARAWKQLKRRAREASLLALIADARAHQRALEAAGLERDTARLALGEAEAALLDARIQSEAAQSRAVEAGREEGAAERERAEHDAALELATKERSLLGDERRRLVEHRERAVQDLAELEQRLAAFRQDEARVAEEVAGRRQAADKLRAAAGQGAAEESRLREAQRGARHELEAGKARALETMGELSRERNALALLRQRHDDAVARLEGHAVAVADQRALQAAARLSAERADLALRSWLDSTADLRDRLRQQELRLQQARAAVTEATAALDGAQAAHRKSASRLESIREVLRGHEGLDEGARALLANPGGACQTLGAVADLLEVPAHLEGAVAAALGDELHAIVVADAESEAAAARWIEEGDQPRTRLVRLSASAPEPLDGALSEQIADGDGARGLSALLLGDVRLSADPRPPRAGERFVVGPGSRRSDLRGLWVGSDRGRTSGLLARRREARTLELRTVELDAAARLAQQQLDAARAHSKAEETQRDVFRRQVHDAELEELGRKRDREEALRETKKLDASVAQAERERATLLTQAEGLARARSAQEIRLPAIVERAERAEAELPGLRDRLSAMEMAHESIRAAAASARVDLAAAEQQQQASERELQRLGPLGADTDRRLQRARADLAGGDARIEWLAQDLERLRTLADSATQARAQASDRVRSGHEGRVAADAASLQLRARHADALRVVEGRRPPVQRAELLAAQAEASLLHDRRQLAAEHDLDLASIPDPGPEPILRVSLPVAAGGPVDLSIERLDDPATPAAARREERRIQREIDNLGAVHLGAVEELQTTEERWSQLTRQLADLEQASADLKLAISRLERETVQRFVAAFEAVQQRFGALYPRLVGGGRAELRLTRPEAPLETGVELIVEPPGKKLQNLVLLSGGEKAMAALALVFAVFQVKPSPFCLLDEVDAPLDEANSRRFGEMLRELASDTQFLVITHNRTTMEVADTLYGVTMQEPGVSTVVSVRLDAGPPESAPYRPHGAA